MENKRHFDIYDFAEATNFRLVADSGIYRTSRTSDREVRYNPSMNVTDVEVYVTKEILKGLPIISTTHGETGDKTSAISSFLKRVLGQTQVNCR